MAVRVKKRFLRRQLGITAIFSLLLGCIGLQATDEPRAIERRIIVRYSPGVVAAERLRKRIARSCGVRVSAKLLSARLRQYLLLTQSLTPAQADTLLRCLQGLEEIQYAEFDQLLPLE